MKKAILKPSGTLLVVGLALTAMLFGCKRKAEPKTESVDPAIFKTDGNGAITGYNCPKDKLPKNLVIPAKIGDEVITSIGESAFRDCTGLTSVSFPASLTSIGKNAFRDCSGLTSVSFPASLTSIGGWAFGGCKGLTSVTVDVGNSTYKAVDNVVYTKDGTTLVFAAGGLTSVNILPSVTSIGLGAFDGCTGITSVSFPASLTSIGLGAFRDCTGITSVSFPASLTSIGTWAFRSCRGLTSVTVDNGNSKYKSVDNVVYTKDGTTLVFAAGGLTSVNILPSVTSIGNGAFDGCTGITSVSFPASLTSIGEGAFSSCDNLTSATFADATGWAVYNDYKYEDRDAYIHRSDLANAATAAKYLREERNNGGYCDRWWKKN